MLSKMLIKTTWGRKRIVPDCALTVSGWRGNPIGSLKDELGRCG